VAYGEHRMSLIQWKEEFKLGVAAMDREHLGLIKAMNDVHELAEQKADKDTVNDAIVELANLTVAHFEAEERHMEKMDYPDLSRHKHIHKTMLSEIGKHHETFLEGDGSVDPAFFKFLVHWLSAHICHIDRKYAMHPTPAGS